MNRNLSALALAAVILLTGCNRDPGGGSSTSDPSRESSFALSSAGASSSDAESSQPSNTQSEEEKYKNAPAPAPASDTKPDDYDTAPVPFRNDTDEFYRQVKELPVPSEHAFDVQNFKSYGFTFRKLNIDGIQLYEAKSDDGQIKPLVIQIHGSGWHKDANVAMDWASAEDVCVVSIDAAGSGESRDGPLQAPAAWMETVKDIDTLIEYYNTVPDVDARNFGLTGSSMGGNISEYYTMYGKYKPRAICIENASADLTNEEASWDCFNKGASGQPPVWEESELWAFTSATAPLAHTECFKDIPMFICVGADDDTHSPANMEKFKNAVEALGNDKIVFHRFENVGHEVPPSWENNERKDFFELMRSPVSEIPDPQPSESQPGSDPDPQPSGGRDGSVIASNTKPGDYDTTPVPFQNEIDKFDKQVKEYTVPLGEDGYDSYHIEQGYKARKLDIGGVQLYEVKKDDGRKKPLVIQIHGGFDCKHLGIALDYAQEGVCCLSVDVAGSGESPDGPLQAPAAWMEAVKDIDILIEYYNTISDVDAENFGLLGFSMGANISELYTIYGKYKPKAICIENASADTTNEGSSWDCFSKGQNALTPIWEESEMWKFTAAIAPLAHTECFKDIPMFICVGAEDDTHSPANMEKFKNAVAALGNDKIVYHAFEGVGHETPQSWADNERRDFFEFMRS